MPEEVKELSPAILFSMPTESLDPSTEETVSYVRKTCCGQKEVLYPADGNDIVVMYMEVSPENNAAIGEAISAIETNCEGFKLFKGWKASSEVGKRAAVLVRTQVFNDIDIPEGE